MSAGSKKYEELPTFTGYGPDDEDEKGAENIKPKSTEDNKSGEEGSDAK